jgi:hypothetical protein
MNIRFRRFLIAFSLALAPALWPQAHPEAVSMAMATGPDGGIGAAAIERALPTPAPDPCRAAEIVASPSRPNWTAGAATTQCNVLEMDFGWLGQPMGHGVHQHILPSSIRNGLTPRIDLRWVAPGPIAEISPGTPTVRGITDHWFSATWRFHDQDVVCPLSSVATESKAPLPIPPRALAAVLPTIS